MENQGFLFPSVLFLSDLKWAAFSNLCCNYNVLLFCLCPAQSGSGRFSYLHGEGSGTESDHTSSSSGARKKTLNVDQQGNLRWGSPLAAILVVATPAVATLCTCGHNTFCRKMAVRRPEVGTRQKHWLEVTKKSLLKPVFNFAHCRFPENHVTPVILSQNKLKTKSKLATNFQVRK